MSDQSGQHALEGVLFAQGPGIRAGHQVQNARLMDMAPTILYTLDEPIPEEMDGVALTDLFEPDALAQRPIRFTSEQVEGPARGPADEESEADREAIRKHLAGLGYLD